MKADVTSKQRVRFPTGDGVELAGILEIPVAQPRAVALYAHCFTCSKDSLAAARICAALAQNGLMTLRFDFRGLGESGGDFAATNLSTNVADIAAAADYLRRTYAAPQLLVGHSLGGIAGVLAAPQLPELRAVALLNSPSYATHLLHYFAERLQEIESQGEATISIYARTQARPFRITRQFVEDLRRHDFKQALAALKLPLLVLQSGKDDLLEASHGEAIIAAAGGEKRLVSLPEADHILTDREQGLQAGNLIAQWAMDYLQLRV